MVDPAAESSLITDFGEDQFDHARQRALAWVIATIDGQSAINYRREDEEETVPLALLTDQTIPPELDVLLSEPLVTSELPRKFTRQESKIVYKALLRVAHSESDISPDAQDYLKRHALLQPEPLRRRLAVASLVGAFRAL